MYAGCLFVLRSMWMKLEKVGSRDFSSATLCFLLALSLQPWESHNKANNLWNFHSWSSPSGDAPSAAASRRENDISFYFYFFSFSRMCQHLAVHMWNFINFQLLLSSHLKTIFHKSEVCKKNSLAQKRKITWINNGNFQLTPAKLSSSGLRLSLFACWFCWWDFGVVQLVLSGDVVLLPSPKNSRGVEKKREKFMSWIFDLFVDLFDKYESSVVATALEVRPRTCKMWK